MPAKTHKIIFPTEEQVPSYLIHHFIRGVFDGDGCISITGKYKSAFSIVGNRPLIEGIQKILVETCDLDYTKVNCKNGDNYAKNIVALVYGGNTQIHKIENYMYKDSTIFLSRKKEKFNSIPQTKIFPKTCCFCEREMEARGMCINHYSKYLYHKNKNKINE